MTTNRFSVINESKFERLSKKELQETKGGLCLSCKKRTRKIELGLDLSLKYKKGDFEATLKVA